MNSSQYCARSRTNSLFCWNTGTNLLMKTINYPFLFRRTSRLVRAPCTRWTRRTCSPATATPWSPTPAARRATASTGCSCSSATCRQELILKGSRVGKKPGFKKKKKPAQCFFLGGGGVSGFFGFFCPDERVFRFFFQFHEYFYVHPDFKL